MSIGTPTIAVQGFDNTDQTTPYNFSSCAFVSGDTYFACMDVERTTATPANPTLAGATSGSWTAVDSSLFNTVAAPRSRVKVFSYVATSSFSESIALTIGGVTHHAVAYIIVRIPGVDTTTPVVQHDSANGDAATSGSVTLAGFGSANNLSLGVFGLDAGANPFTGGSGSFTLLGQQSSSAPGASVGVVYLLNGGSPGITFASHDWGGVGLEVKAAASGTSTFPRGRVDGLGTRMGSRQLLGGAV